MDWSKVKYFTEDEFRCKCGCGKALMDQDFVQELDDLRELLGFPIIISSGYRCPEHNAAVSSTGLDGPHTTGKAADLALSFSQARDAMNLIPSFFSGFGLKQHGQSRFIHVDQLEYRLWTYPQAS